MTGLLRQLVTMKALLKGIISNTKVMNPVNFVDMELNNDVRG
jgi:hypothetical protein